MAKIVNQEEDTKVEDPTQEEPEVNEDEQPVDTEEEWDTRKMDPEEELWPGGPNVGQLNRWKDKYGRVYITEFLGEFFIWRTLSRSEYRAMARQLEEALANGQSQAMASLDNEDSIAELCILYPKYDRENTTGSMAGVATSISSQVMEASGFQPTDVREL